MVLSRLKQEKTGLNKPLDVPQPMGMPAHVFEAALCFPVERTGRDHRLDLLAGLSAGSLGTEFHLADALNR